MKTNKGFTLIEIAVVLAIIAILAAILTPIVTSYIDQARTTRAQSDVKKIAEAALLYKRDTGVWPGYASGASTHATNNDGVGLADCLRSDSSSANVSTSAGLGSALVTFCVTTTGDMQAALNVNTLGLTAGNPIGGQTAFRGPYLDGLGGVDPWGTPYVVTSKNFASATNYAFAISAGPDAIFQTSFTQARTAAFSNNSSDDITAIIH